MSLASNGFDSRQSTFLRGVGAGLLVGDGRVEALLGSVSVVIVGVS